VPEANTEERRLTAIMFTDMVGYSALAQRNEALALELLEEHRRLLRGLFPRFNGREVETMGDGFLVEFGSVLEAARCAIEIQRALATRNISASPERQVRLRIGLHVGDVVHRDGHVLGDGVNIAEPGGICVSTDVERQLRNALEARFERLGPTELKNIQAPMELFRIVLPWEKPGSGRPEEAQTKREKPRAGGDSKSQSLFTAGAAKFVWITALGLLAIGIGWWSVQRPHEGTKQIPTQPSISSSPASTTAPLLNQKSIAVLPFVTMSADKADEYLSDGMTEELLSALAKVKSLRVPGRSSCFAFKGKAEEDIFHKVAEQLHVNTVLEGSVRKVGNKVRVTVQLINVADGFHLWSETYDRDLTDILAIQSDVAQRVVQALQVQLGIEETRALARKPTENAEAHRLYLLGRFHFAKSSQESWTNAMRYFQQAIELDPSYVLAYCGLADNYSWWSAGLIMPGKEAWPKAKESAQKALALNPNLADAHLSLSLALGGLFDWQGCEHEIQRALELNPNLALAYDEYAWLLACFARFDEAISQQNKAMETDPLSLVVNSDLGLFLYRAGRYEQAIAQCRKTLELDPNYAWGHLLCGLCALWQGETTTAIAEFQRAKALDPLPWFDGWLGYAYATSGERTQAEEILREAEALAKQRYIPPEINMLVYLGLGDKEKALGWLERCYQEQDGTCWWLKVDHVYDGLRKEPRFQALLRKVGLDQ